MTSEQEAVAARRIVDVRFEEKRVVLELHDGRRLATPLSWVSRAAALPDEQRTAWVVVADGLGVNWPAAGQTSATGALEVWVLEQDALYERALAAAKAAEWNADALAPHDRELLALWRLDADVNNGGFLQFLGNWGVAEVAHALRGLDAIGARRSHELVSAAWNLIRPLVESDDVNSIDDLIRALGEEGSIASRRDRRGVLGRPGRDAAPRLAALRPGSVCACLRTALLRTARF